MKKSFVVLLHIGFWTCYCLLIFIMLAVSYRSSIHVHNQEFRITNVLKTLFFFAFIPSLISYILNYSVLFPRFFQHKKFILAIAFNILVSTGSALTGYALLHYFIASGYIMDMQHSGESSISTTAIEIMIMAFIAFVCGIIALVIKGFITWVNEIKLKELLKEKSHEMEMALIKLQLDPHLLFNTINNIDALILKDAVSASAYLNKLSDIMRFILYETKTDNILLSKEIEYIEKYIALQKIRTANENYIAFSVTGFAGNKVIAPMIFIPFIENAFKHCNNKKLENAIVIHILITDKAIQLQCNNKFYPESNTLHTAGGLGNELIQKRLSLVYPGKHTLEVHKTNGLYSLNLTIINE